MNQKTPHVSRNSGNNEWHTPPEIIDLARLVLRKIDLDPASNEIANQSVKATRFFTEQDDGLQKQWRGKVWMNPPYSRGLVKRFVLKFTGHFITGGIVEGIVLVNNATETEWWNMLARMSAAICFPKGRIKFIGQSGKLNSPLQGQTIFYFGENKKQFVSVFSRIGLVVTHASDLK